MLSTVYLALDVHVAHTVLGQMDAKGTFLGSRRFATTAEELTAALRSLQARRKLLTLEEGPLARWVAQLARPLCAQVLVCDPRHNRLITQAARKDDEADVRSLCRLLRLGELHEVHHPRDEGRAVFKAALREDQRLKRHEVWCQLQIKALYRGWGVLHFSGNAVYRPATRAGFLERIAQPPIRDQLARLYALLDTAVALRTQCWSQIATLGRAEPIIAEFQKVPGVGPIGAHLFAAFIQEPARFASKQALWRYARLSIVQRSSDGKQPGHQRLERKGNSALKAMSYDAWKGALQTKAPNPVKTFFEQSLARTGSRTHARLNTQRKILATLWSLWRHKSPWRPELFHTDNSNPAPPAAAAADS